MKKKIIFAVATGLFALATVFNMNVLQSNSADDISLESLMSIANATPEMDGGMLPGVTIYGMDLSGGTTYTGGDGYPSIQWYSYWYRTDPSGQSGTQAEINKMQRDLKKGRRPASRTINQGYTSNSVGGTAGWTLFVEGTVDYNRTYNPRTYSDTVSCCLLDQNFSSTCTHLPPCEMYS